MEEEEGHCSRRLARHGYSSFKRMVAVDWGMGGSCGGGRDRGPKEKHVEVAVEEDVVVEEEEEVVVVVVVLEVVEAVGVVFRGGSAAAAAAAAAGAGGGGGE